MDTLCKCGCGKIVKTGNIFILGHNSFSIIKSTTVKLQAWRKLVLARDNYICQLCFDEKVCKRINAHHIKSKEEFPELMYDVNNGQTLCNSCHTAIHGNFFRRRGMHWSEEHNQKMREKMKGRIFSERTKKIIAENMKKIWKGRKRLSLLKTIVATKGGIYV